MDQRSNDHEKIVNQDEDDERVMRNNTGDKGRAVMRL